MRKPTWLTAFVAAAWLTVGTTTALAADRPPNFVILFADDLGYGDLGCYGHPTIRTPNLDRMAVEGLRFTQFYCSAPVCTPSRAGLLTGRLAVRSGMCSNTANVLYADGAGGLPSDEVTLAEVLKTGGYATACIGKWHLGHLPQYLPRKQGFDYYYGLPFSNDMNKRPSGGVPLMRNEEIIEDPADLDTLTPRYTDEAIRFINENADKPFFLYLPYTYPHVPLHASDAFRGRSARGLYGDAVEELDHSVGRILDTIRSKKLAANTLVFFTSDNGPWIPKNQDGGSAGLLRDGKGTTWEGGMREPGIAWWPGKIEPAITQELASTLDFMPTIAKLAGVATPSDRPLDGYDISAVLLGTGPSLRDRMFYYNGTDLFAYRKGQYKVHVRTSSYCHKNVADFTPPQLFDLLSDPSEKYDIAAKHRDVVADMQKDMAAFQASFTPGPSQLDPRIGK